MKGTLMHYRKKWGKEGRGANIKKQIGRSDNTYIDVMG
jgi:hypothetical protein